MGIPPLSFRTFGLRRHLRSLRPVLATGLCIQKFRSPRPGCDGPVPLGSPGILGVFGTKTDLSSPVRIYRGFNPRASNCWLHSAGASRSRSTPIPRGKRPSTAARTRSGARNASEIVHVDLAHAAFLTCRDLLKVGHGARNDFTKPATASGNGADEARATLNPGRTNFVSGNTMRGKDLPLSLYCCGFNPSASNCRLHSAGASRSRSILMPRGRRPSTAARTSLGARKASEIVMLT